MDNRGFGGACGQGGRPGGAVSFDHSSPIAARSARPPPTQLADRAPPAVSLAVAPSAAPTLSSPPLGGGLGRGAAPLSRHPFGSLTPRPESPRARRPGPPLRRPSFPRPT